MFVEGEECEDIATSGDCGMSVGKQLFTSADFTGGMVFRKVVLCWTSFEFISGSCERRVVTKIQQQKYVTSEFTNFRLEQLKLSCLSFKFIGIT